MLNFFTVALPFMATVTTNMATLPETSISLNSQTAIPEMVEPEKPKEKRLTCKGCNQNEIFVLDALQEHGIKDKNALATIMGNIKQESQFISNICEGGKRVSYHQCKSGGFGISQWTSSDRYYGLGQFAAKIGGDPSNLDTQVKYMFYEKDWKLIESDLKTPGRTITDYMRLANRWLRWGIKGPREHYARQYLSQFEYTVVNS